MIRVTTNGVLKSYRANLNKSNIKLDSARNTVLTQRNFDSYAADPAAAAQAFKLRREYSRTDSQLSVSESTSRKFDSAYSVIDGVVSLVDNEKSTSAWASVLQGASDTSGAGRNALGQQMSQLAESIVQSMNTQYADNYLFAGADGLNVPFTWENGELFYRGVSVDAATGTEDYAKLDYRGRQGQSNNR